MTKTMKVEGPLHVVCQCDKCKAQPEQEPVVRGEFLERNQYEIASLVTQLIFIAAVIILGVLI